MPETATTYAPTWESVSTHPLPAWYDDAKIGIFIHWGLYSVPAWAPRVGNIQDLFRQRGPAGLMRENPYAEWYLNSLQVEGSPTQAHHRETFGAAFPYEGFVPGFDRESAEADLDALAALCKAGGAGYVVLTTKHHDGFTLWPSAQAHPRMGAYHARRDLVGDLTEAVRAQGMRMGLYYSGGYDWPWNDAVLTGIAAMAFGMPVDPAYEAYAAAHVRELIARYAPSILWNDISWPPGETLPALFAEYYNAVPDGLVNDRWSQKALPRNAATAGAMRVIGGALQKGWRFLPESRRGLVIPPVRHCDITTPEYAQHDDIVWKKWESTRGVGHSFGANTNEQPGDILTTGELVRMVADVVSKNGNLRIGIGPLADGSIPRLQQVRIRGLGDWLAVNGEAIYGTRPWSVAAGRTSAGDDVRFTRKREDLFVLFLDGPSATECALPVAAPGDGEVRAELLGVGTIAAGVAGDGRIVVRMPDRLPVSPVQVVRLAAGGGEGFVSHP
ncbi:MAG: alpha-L-fucosidase [Thermomicrobiales bacterium]